MNLYVINHGFHYELENVARLFFPNEKITVVRECERKEEPYIYTEMSDKLTVEVKAGDFNKSLNTEIQAKIMKRNFRLHRCFINFCVNLQA